MKYYGNQSLRRADGSRHEAAAPADAVPKPSLLSTLILITGIASTIGTLHGDTPQEIAAYAAWGFGLSLVASMLVDIRSGIRNLARVDVMALFSLFFLTFFEFLLPQKSIDTALIPSSLYAGCTACAWGFCGLAIGRHVPTLGHARFSEMFQRPVSPGLIIKLYWLCFVVGYFYMMLAVNFNPIEMVSQFTEARFAQPWSRGQFGDLKALLGELGMLLYVVPAISGVVLAKRNVYTKAQVWQVSLGFAFTLFYGFSSGTRNVFASYLVTFLIGYAFSLPRGKHWNLIIVSSLVAVSLLAATRLMLEFRSTGLKYYLNGEVSMEDAKEKDFFVDYNLYVICRLVEVFPSRYQFLGWEVPYNAIIRPIPRGLWKGKPEGLSVSIEEALGASGLTLASSFIGESYVAFGNAGVFCIGLFFGAVFGWWGGLASPRNSDFGVLIYASGFFAAVISMRSLFVFTTAVLPTVGAIMAGQWIVGKRKPRKRLLAGGDPG